WYAMNSRCYDESHASFERYGAKGIKVCEVWRGDYESFYKWALENGYEDSLTIDRIDSAKDYNPQNCRWANYFTQTQNRRNFRNNTTGVQGASLQKNGRYRMMLRRDHKIYNLGMYDTLSECKEVREEAL